MRAAVDRVGIDSHGRSTKVQIRRVRKGDLAKARDVIEQTFTDFLERQLGTRPRQPFGGAQYVHHRWLMEPWGCFVAEEDQSKIVGAALAVTWGAVGLLGPVAVLTNYQNQKIGQQLILAVEEFFEENKTALQGVVTYPTSPKHLLLYSTLLVGLQHPHQVGLPGRLHHGPHAARQAGGLRGLDPSGPRRLALNALLAVLLGAVLAVAPATVAAHSLLLEAPPAADALLPEPPTEIALRFNSRVENLEQSLAAVEEAAAEIGVQRVILPVYTRYWSAYSTLIKWGYQVDFTMVRMQRGKQEDYEDSTHLVLDDWR